MLERERELAVLGGALAAATTGRGSVVVVAGEAGIGKTTLIKAFRRTVPGRVRVLDGACDDLLAPPTLGPLREAVRRQPGPLADALAGGDPEQVFGGVVDELSGPAPTLLVVEDLHWADDATIDVLRYLVRRLDTLPAVLVLSLRDDTTGHSDRLTRLLAAIAAVGGPRLDLRPLSADAVAALAAPAGRTGDDLVQLTGGNPFYVTEVLAGPPVPSPPPWPRPCWPGCRAWARTPAAGSSSSPCSAARSSCRWPQTCSATGSPAWSRRSRAG